MNDENASEWKKYYMTILLLVINIICYILSVQFGEIVYHIGCIDAERVLLQHQYYRLISGMFLHAGIEHIVSNMIFLAGLGQMVERAIGHIRYIVLYLLSGLCGSALSIAHSILSGELYSSVGASGAIFGLIGALFVLVLASHGKFQGISVRRMLFAVAYMVYSGVGAQRIDNAAHIGGLIGGIFIMAVINLIKAYKIVK